MPRLLASRFRSFTNVFAVVLLSTLAAGPGAAADGGERVLDIEVDARDFPRRLLHAQITIPCRPGKLRLWYPKWVPGTHGPYGPVQNVAGLRLQTPQGQPLVWRRGETEPLADRGVCDPGVILN